MGWETIAGVGFVDALFDSSDSTEGLNGLASVDGTGAGADMPTTGGPITGPGAAEYGGA